MAEQIVWVVYKSSGSYDEYYTDMDSIWSSKELGVQEVVRLTGIMTDKYADPQMKKLDPRLDNYVDYSGPFPMVVDYPSDAPDKEGENNDED